MKKLLSLVLAAGMLVSAYAPAVYALADTAPTAVEETATPESAAPDTVQIPEGQLQTAPQTAAMSLADPSELGLSFHVTTADGIDFTSEDPFAQMTMVVGKEYTLEPLVGGQTLAEAGYQLSDCHFIKNDQDKLYLTVKDFNSPAGTMVVTPTEASTHEVFLGNLSMTVVKQDGESSTITFPCFGTTVDDSGHSLFVNADTQAPISSLEATPDNQTFKLQVPLQAGWTEGTVTITYGTSAPGSVNWTENSFDSVTLTVGNAISSDTSFYATVKDKTTGTILSSFSVALSWYTPIKADTLPGNDRICFGTKNTDTGTYSAFYNTQYNQVPGSSRQGTLSVFFGTPNEVGYIKDYHDQPNGATVQSITVESLTQDTVTVQDLTSSTDGTPFTFQYTIQLNTCTTAEIQATVTLADGASYTALFTIDVVENLQTQTMTVRTSEELTAALASPQLTSGSTIYLEPGTYVGDFTVPTPVKLIASQYNGPEDLFDETGAPIEKENLTIIQGTITAEASNVEVFGLRFQCPEGQSGLTALTDANYVTGCTFTGYENALVLAKSVQNNANYRIQKNAFVGNTVALRFAGREWMSNVQNNSFLNNGTALLLDQFFYIDGSASTVYGGKINGGKWTNNFFRGTEGQRVLQDNAQSNSNTLVLDYNYYAYGSMVGSDDSLFSTDSCATYDVFFTSPALTAVSTNASLSALANAGGLNLVAQQTDLASDSAVNASSELFSALQNDASASDLTLNVWTAKEQLAAVWEFPKDELTNPAVDVNLAVDDTLTAGESKVVDAQLPDGVTAQTVSFAHDGALPGTATVEVPKSAELTSTEDLGLYYIDEATGELELQDTAVTVTESGNLQFSIDHCSSYLVAPKSDMAPAAPDAPNASVVTIDYTGETLSFDSAAYEVNTNADFTGQALTPGASLQDLIGNSPVTLYVRVKAQGGVPASEATAVTLPARPAAPDTVQTTPTSYADEADGTLTGTSGSMEYRAEGTGNWTPCYSEQVFRLPAGNYEVRYLALSDAFASMPATVTVDAGPERNYSISIDDLTLDTITYGETPVAKPLVITNNGNCDVMILAFGVDVNSVFSFQGNGDFIVPVQGTLKSYVIQAEDGLNAGSYEGTVEVTYQAGSDTRTAIAALHLTVNKADATDAMKAVSGSATVGSTGTLTLPALPEDAVYGTPSTNANLANVTLKDGELAFTMGDSLTAGQTCTITIPVTGAKNYNDYTLTVTLTATAKPVPQVKVSDLTREYNGLAVTVNDLAKTAVYDGKAVEGSWQFIDPAQEIKNAGSYSAQLRFTPKDTTFDSVTAPVSIQIQRRPLEVTPTLSNNLLTVGEPINSIGTLTTGLVGGDTLIPVGESLTFKDFDGLPGNTNEPGQYVISVKREVQDTLAQSEVGKNYQITFLTRTLIIVEEDSTLDYIIPGTQDGTGDYKVVKGDLQPEPESQYQSVEQIKEKLTYELNVRLDEVTADNSRLLDVSLLFKEEGSDYWEKVTGDDFPKEGVQVTLSKENLEITDDLADYTFTVLHLCHDGRIEQPTVTKTKNGITFTLTSFSPVAISWAPVKEVQTTVTGGAGTTPSVTPAPTAAPAAGGTVYYTCPACGYHNWTATEEGYRCDHCGYLESVKQLSGYGNVQGVYEPRSSSAQSGVQSLLSHIPATGDESQPLVWVVLLAVAALALGGLVWYKRKND